MMTIEKTLKKTLTQLQMVLSRLSHEEYGMPLHVLSNASIGQHTRHVIEFFQTLTENYDIGIFNYDQRKRNKLLETNRDLAYNELSIIIASVARDDKEILLTTNDTPDEFKVTSSYFREIIYNLEHAVHHMAMIRIGIRQSTNLLLPADFGVASATIEYKKSIL